MRRAALIVNPFATGVSESSLAAVRSALRPHAELETQLTERPRHATELATGALRDGFDAILVFSGDGGFNEVLNGIESDIAVGFIPGGGTSVLPRALGLPRDPVAAAHRIGEALELGRTRRISLGRVNGRRFAFNAGTGIDAEAVRRFNTLGRSAEGHRPGDLRFALTLVSVLRSRGFRYPPAAELVGVGPVAFVIVSNSPVYTYVGSRPLSLTPEASFEGGLDAVAPRSIGRRDVPRLARYVFTGAASLRRTDVAYLHDRDRIEVRCDPALPLQADGEDLGDVEEAIFECDRGAVSVLV
jgi:diacylglycerol kinase family enzyme